MRKIVGACNTRVILEGDKPQQICRLGQGPKCCAFLVCGSDGFECARMDYPTNVPIMKRIDEGTMNAKGTGGWEGCVWEGIYYTPERRNAPKLDSDPG